MSAIEHENTDHEFEVAPANGVVIIPTTVGSRRLVLRRAYAHLTEDVLEFPRRIVLKDSAAEAERCLFEATGLQATCRKIRSICPDTSSDSPVFGVYEAYIDALSEETIPEPTDPDARWLDAEEFALCHRDLPVADALTLSALAIQSIEAATAEV